MARWRSGKKNRDLASVESSLGELDPATSSDEVALAQALPSVPAATRIDLPVPAARRISIQEQPKAEPPVPSRSPQAPSRPNIKLPTLPLQTVPLPPAQDGLRPPTSPSSPPTGIADASRPTTEAFSPEPAPVEFPVIERAVWDDSIRSVGSDDVSAVLIGERLVLLPVSVDLARTVGFTALQPKRSLLRETGALDGLVADDGREVRRPKPVAPSPSSGHVGTTTDVSGGVEHPGSTATPAGPVAKPTLTQAKLRVRVMAGLRAEAPSGGLPELAAHLDGVLAARNATENSMANATENSMANATENSMANATENSTESPRETSTTNPADRSDSAQAATALSTDPSTDPSPSNLAPTELTAEQERQIAAVQSIDPAGVETIEARRVLAADSTAPSGTNAPSSVRRINLDAIEEREDDRRIVVEEEQSAFAPDPDGLPVPAPFVEPGLRPWLLRRAARPSKSTPDLVEEPLPPVDPDRFVSTSATVASDGPEDDAELAVFLREGEDVDAALAPERTESFPIAPGAPAHKIVFARAVLAPVVVEPKRTYVDTIPVALPVPEPEWAQALPVLFGQALRGGTLVVLCGPTSCGKTTELMSLVSSRIPEGHDGAHGLQSGVPSVLDQFPVWVPEATVTEQVLRFAGASAEELATLARHGDMAPGRSRWSDSALERFGIAALAGRTVLSLSGGERQRVALAAAMLPETDLRILDNPTANLDEEGLRLLLEAINEDLLNGVAVVVASNDSGLMVLADRIIDLAKLAASRRLSVA
jgi:ABC-type cobalamin/Fe3+-siderophores transport system ATPase subunit